MRTLRLSLMGMVMLGLLLGRTGASGAQEPVVATGPENTWVTLDHQECEWASGAPGHTDGGGDGFEWLRGYRTTCEVTFSDPRVSGPLTQTVDEDWYGKYGPIVAWGNETLVGPGGTWTGWYQGIGDPEGEDQPTYHVMTGSDGYEGLTFIWERSWAEQPIGGAWRGTGFIYEGDPPPVSDAIEPPTE